MQKGSWKLTVGCIAALAAVVTMSVQGATPVASKNIVGYVKIDLTPNTFFLLSNPFNQVDGSVPTVAKVLGNQVPPQSRVYLRSGAGWDSAIKFANWNKPNLEMPPGTGWWLTSPAAVSLLLMGEVPDAASYNANFAANSSNLIGYPYPVEKTLTTSGLATAPPQSRAYFWTGTTWDTAVKFAAWNKNLTMGLGEGFWLTMPAATGFAWTEAKPY